MRLVELQDENTDLIDESKTKAVMMDDQQL